VPTPQRLFRLGQALHHRQPEIRLALDGVHDPHNLAAIIRTCDATGIPEVMWRPDETDPAPPNPEVSRGAERWVLLRPVHDLLGELRAAQKRGFRVAATHLNRKAVDFRSIDWTERWVLVMGNEKRGCTDEILEVADRNIFLPMCGLVQSLNVSVATAVLLYEVQRQREAAGLYRRSLPASVARTFYDSWDLEREGIPFDDVRQAPDPLNPPAPTPHVDGRKRDCFSRRKPA